LIQDIVSMNNPIIFPYHDTFLNVVISFLIELGLSVLIFLAIYAVFLRRTGHRRRVVEDHVTVFITLVFILVFVIVYVTLNLTTSILGLLSH
jgi:Kef-type K+ transport system membrane component KefB